MKKANTQKNTTPSKIDRDVFVKSGSKGGRKTKLKGREYYSKIGKKGSYIRWNNMKNKIYEMAGLKSLGKDVDGEPEYIGTKKQWDDADRMWDEYINHDCHNSPEDGCVVCAKYNGSI